MVMKKEQYYIRERIYTTKKGKVNKEKLEFWQAVLGTELVENLYNSKPEVAAYLENQDWIPYLEKDNFDSIIIEDKSDELIIEQFYQKNPQYSKILSNFIKKGYWELKSETESLKICSEAFYIEFLRGLLLELESMSVRILIREKENNLGMEEILNKYPVLERCLCETVSKKVTFFIDVIMRLEKDKLEIEKKILDGDSFKYVSRIDNRLSDLHFGGQSVMKLILDNGKSIIYKPHSLENEIWFSKFLSFFGKNCDMEMYQLKVVDRKNYGWVECIEQYDCEDCEQIKRYYKRIGISLFAAYLLGTNDIHCENLISMGEYPIVVDLENLVGCTQVGKQKGFQIKESVLGSGILPYYYWSREDKGIDISALAGGTNEKLPFKIPVIKKNATNGMYVDYEYGELEKAKNRVIFNGKVVEPKNFEREIMLGFEMAYTCALRKKEEVEKILSTLNGIRSRYLISDTQKYSMLLSSSYHPSVMENAADREILFYSLWKGKTLKDKTVESEIYDLIHGDIPFFYFVMKNTCLYDSQGNEFKDYFAESPIKSVYKRFARMDKEDLEKQKTFIHLSLSAYGEEKELDVKYKQLRDIIENSEKYSKKEILKSAEYLADKLINESIYDMDSNQINWLNVNLFEEKSGAITINTCGMYLYNGLAGISIFLHMLCKYSKDKKYQRICELLDEQLFAYTDAVEENIELVQSDNAGLYNGEGSIVYTYLILFWLNKNKTYLEYAQKHAVVLVEIAKKDKNCDLLDGRAGAIIVFSCMYETLHEKYYLNIAEEIYEELIQDAIDAEDGMRWKQLNEKEPLLGMAHGNAGIMIAFKKLYQLTGNKKYYESLRKTLYYENKNYDSLNGDWKDFRNKDEKLTHTMPVAWCHGAGGILLSRLIIDTIKLEKEEKEMIATDIRRAISYIKKHKERKELCLCHGMCGNILILDKYNKRMGDRQETEELVGEKDKNILTKEWYNPGLMNGYSGLGYFLLMKIGDFPNYILGDE